MVLNVVVRVILILVIISAGVLSLSGIVDHDYVKSLFWLVFTIWMSVLLREFVLYEDKRKL